MTDRNESASATLQRRAHRGARRSVQNPKSKIQNALAFTLVEMLVSLAVIVVALAVVVTAFTITTKTARQAAAFAELQGWVRQFAFQIQEDLRHCEPSQGILVIAGRTQPAGLTDADVTAQRHLRFLTGNPNEPGLRNYDPVF